MSNSRFCFLLVLLVLLGGHTVRVSAQQAHVNIDWKPQKNTENLVPLSAKVISPEVKDDRTVIFRLLAPDAHEVLLNGMSLQTGQRNPIPFTKGNDGIWTLTVGPFEPNIYLYSFTIDGVNVIDPNNTFTGHANMPSFSMLWVHGDAPAFYDAKKVPHGDLTTHFYYSEVTQGERYMIVYTPPGYDPSKAYPVLYLMGGSGDLPETWTMHGQINFIMDNMLAEKKMVPMIVVIPNNQMVHRRHPNHQELSFPLIEREYKECIIPFVESRYKVIDSPHGRAISGLSMGGRHAQYVGLRNLDKFGSIGLLSAALPIENTPVLNTPEVVNSALDYFFVGAGPHETRPGVRHEVLHQQLDSLGVKHEYYVGGPGGHDLLTWRHLMYERFLKELFKSASAQVQLPGIAPETNINPNGFPRILPDLSVMFSIKAPDAQRIEVTVGIGNRFDLKKGNDGVWTVTTDPIEPGFHYYTFVIDGVSVSDPASESFYGTGRMCSAIDIPEAGCDFYNLKDVPQGVIRSANYYSEVTNSWRPVNIYTPPGYDKNVNKKYPVLYIQHGGGEDHRGWAVQGKTGTILDNLIAEGKAQEMIVVIANGNVGRGAGNRAMEPFIEEMTQNIIPYIENNYRTLTDQKYRAIAGLSMGGGQSFYTGLQNTSLFGSVGIFSSGIFRGASQGGTTLDPEKEIPGLLSDSKSFNERLRLFYISVGEQDARIEGTRKHIENFKQHGLNVTFATFPGDHEWQVWRKSLHDFASRLFR